MAASVMSQTAFAGKTDQGRQFGGVPGEDQGSFSHGSDRRGHNVLVYLSQSAAIQEGGEETLVEDALPRPEDTPVHPGDSRSKLRLMQVSSKHLHALYVLGQVWLFKGEDCPE